MKILDTEIDFDIEEAENLDKVIELDKQYSEKIKDAKTMVEQCSIYKAFFDELIGEGTSNKIFGNKNKISELIDAYTAIFDEAELFANKINEKKNSLNNKIERYKR